MAPTTRRCTQNLSSNSGESSHQPGDPQLEIPEQDEIQPPPAKKAKQEKMDTTKENFWDIGNGHYVSYTTEGKGEAINIRPYNEKDGEGVSLSWNVFKSLNHLYNRLKNSRPRKRRRGEQ